MTVFVDLDCHQVIDVVEGCHAAAVTGRLELQDPVWRSQVTTVALDPHAGYPHRGDRPARWVRQRQPVGDCFHVVKLAGAAIDDVRRRTLGHRGHKHDPLYRIPGRYWPGSKGSTPTRWAESTRPWRPATDEVGRAWTAKELVRAMFANREPDIAPLGSSRSATGACWSRSPNRSGSRPRCRAGRMRSSPTTVPAGSRQPESKPST